MLIDIFVGDVNVVGVWLIKSDFDLFVLIVVIGGQVQWQCFCKYLDRKGRLQVVVDYKQVVGEVNCFLSLVEKVIEVVVQ